MLDDVRKVIAYLFAVNNGAIIHLSPGEQDRLLALAVEHGLLNFNARAIDRGRQHILSPGRLTPVGEACLAACKDGTWGQAIGRLVDRKEEVTLEEMIQAVGARERTGSGI